MASKNSIEYVTTTTPKEFSILENELTSRYKCPQLQIETHGKNKMIKTLFLNIDKVAKSLHIESCFILKFVGFELGCKVHEKEKYISGKYSPAELNHVINQFIKQVILCPKCKLPELKHYGTSSNVFGTCVACGWDDELIVKNSKMTKFMAKYLHSQRKKLDFSKHIDVEEENENSDIDPEFDDLVNQFNFISTVFVPREETSNDFT